MRDVDLARLRREYAESGLSEQDAGDDPIALFDSWLEAAFEAGIHEPNAMALATATPDGRPSVRMVLLKGFAADGARFFTNYSSRKASELVANPYAAATMLWHQLQRQVRIEGPVSPLPYADSDAYFSSRPRGSRIGAIASPQSQVVAGRDELDRRYAEADAAHGQDVPRPEHWGGYLIRPDILEFWQGRQSRMHDRIRFVRKASGWRRERLAP